MKKKWEVGKRYKICGYEPFATEKVLRRLLEFGFTRKESFRIAYKSLLGKSVIVEIRGFCLSVRVEFLNYLQVSNET